jgi:hypothetical protein
VTEQFIDDLLADKKPAMNTSVWKRVGGAGLEASDKPE